jgi:hypothetical protein
MNKPSRFQRSRQTKLPPGTVCVTRPGKWGNPFKKGEPGIETNADAARLYRAWIQDTPEGRLVTDRARRELSGRNLACWCKPGSPCHADILLEIANRKAGAE